MTRQQPTPLAIRLPQNLRTEISEYCAEIGWNRHGFCVAAIKFFLKQHKSVHSRLRKPKQAKTPAA